jgi:hypothetical protein
VDGRDLGLLIAGAGIVVVLVGLAMATGLLGWFGRLPGDIRIELDGLRVYAPIASMLLISIALSALLYAVRRIF